MQEKPTELTFQNLKNLLGILKKDEKERGYKYSFTKEYDKAINQKDFTHHVKRK